MRKYRSITAISHHTHTKALAGAFVFLDNLQYYLERLKLQEITMSINDLGMIALIVGTALFIGVTIKEFARIYKDAKNYGHALQKYADAIRNGEAPPPLH
jgi:hypothetical protein